MRSKNTEAFIGCDSEYCDADIVIFGAPMDSTASYRPGARFGPKAIRAESFGLETYSPYQDRDLSDIRVFDAGDLELPFGNAEKALNKIEEFADKILSDGKLPVALGGEHLAALGAIRAAARRHPGLAVIHFDAHADLRDDYLGEKLSHATVIRRIWDILGDGRIFQFGIRSGDRPEFIWAKDHIFMNKFDFRGLPEVLEGLRGNPLYFTLDLDVLDPSELPGTGTPEAGGVGFSELLSAIRAVCGLEIVGADICELAPMLDPGGASAVTAGKLLRELLLAIKT